MPPKLLFFTGRKAGVAHTVTTSVSGESRQGQDKPEVVETETKVSSCNALHISNAN